MIDQGVILVRMQWLNTRVFKIKVHATTYMANQMKLSFP